MDKIRISIIIHSMLNDAMIEVNDLKSMETAQERLRFVKYLVHMFPDTTTGVDIDTVYEQFKLVDIK